MVHFIKPNVFPCQIISFYYFSRHIQRELNPIEQVWQYLKRRLRWLLPKNLDDLRAALYLEIDKLTKPIIASIARRRYILMALSVAGF
ncbi:hypothetical protein [Nostoc sp.]|uniref:hypothetical protein n=1 Tax=Nostoc sp. TaxID=1180 RepID=UPI002FF727AB